jgi:hypothetical protein
MDLNAERRFNMVFLPKSWGAASRCESDDSLNTRTECFAVSFVNNPVRDCLQ